MYHQSFADISDLLQSKYRIEPDTFSFIFETINPELRGLDILELVKSGEISKYADKIVAEAINNPWYFFRELLRVPTQGTDLSYTNCEPFWVNEGTLCALMCYTNDMSFILETPRQTGRSILLSALIVYESFVKGRLENLYHDTSLDAKKMFIHHKVLDLISVNEPILKLFRSWIDYKDVFLAKMRENTSKETGPECVIRGYKVADNASLFIGNLEFYLSRNLPKGTPCINDIVWSWLINGHGMFQRLYAESCFNTNDTDPDNSLNMLDYVLDYGLVQVNIHTMKRMFYDGKTFIKFLKEMTGYKPVRIYFGGFDMISTKGKEEYFKDIFGFNVDSPYATRAMNNEFYLKR